jgi:PIN domain nuclease of toxin-antitoxin system
MKLLLDTHAFLWALGQRRKLPTSVVAAILGPENEVFVSAVSAWEITQKRWRRKLEFDGDFLADFDTRLRDLGFASLVLTSAHMVLGASLTAAHKDSFDPMLVGQALCEGLTVVTVDAAIAALGADVMS